MLNPSSSPLEDVRDLHPLYRNSVVAGASGAVQSYLPLSQMPTWASDLGPGHIAPRAVLLRVFAVSDGAQSWRADGCDAGSAGERRTHRREAADVLMSISVHTVVLVL